LRALGITDASIRLGHVGLILELLSRCGLPPASTSALVESLSEAAAEGRGVSAIELALDRLAGWLGAADRGADRPLITEPIEDHGVDRLFRHMVPDVTGRRTGGEVVSRLRRKWALGHSLHEALDRLRDQVHSLAELRGPAETILLRLEKDYASLAPESVAALRSLLAMLSHHGVDTSRLELDLGFGRGIGFYTRMIFELTVPTPAGPVEVCGGGRYDGLARVLGSCRDDRGVGFAFGLERLQSVFDARAAGASQRPEAAHGYVVTSGIPGEITASTIDLATFLRERIQIPIVVVDLEFQAAVEHARARRLSHVVTVGRTIELWDLKHGDVRSIREGELINEMRARLDVFGENDP
jgi:histidyl-tRNA synthetase